GGRAAGRGGRVAQGRVGRGNVAEGAGLIGRPIEDVAGMREAARVLVGRGARAALVKGGHLPHRPIDVLAVGTDVHDLDAARIPSGPTHGTGCTLSAGIAAALAGGADLLAAVMRARRFVHRALAAAPRIGGGGGPLDPRVTSGCRGMVDNPAGDSEAFRMADGSLAPSLLLAMPQLRDPNFSRAVVLLCEHGPDGAVGFVVNRPTDIRAANAVALDPPPQRDSGLRLWTGGPVETNRGFLLLGNGPGSDGQHGYGGGIYP